MGYNLEFEGYVVENVARGDEAELRLAENAPDLVILDWMLPGVSGLEICRRLRARGGHPHASGHHGDCARRGSQRVRGLSVGADDYVVKPFSVPELMARVPALLRRSRPERIAERLYAGDLDLDPETRRVRRGVRDIHLGLTEFRLLDILLEKPGWVFSRAQLLDAVWGRRRRSTSAPLTSTSGGCARRSRAAGNAIRSAPFEVAGYAFDETFGKV